MVELEKEEKLKKRVGKEINLIFNIKVDKK